MHHIEIDKDSGFCFGVTTAISKAEEELAKGVPLYCLGDIVHNGQECERLKEMGLITINHEEFARLKNVKVLLRAHGEPPETYELAQKNHIEIIDATCPVVLRLQKESSRSMIPLLVTKTDRLSFTGKTAMRKCWDWSVRPKAKPSSSRSWKRSANWT